MSGITSAGYVVLFTLAAIGVAACVLAYKIHKNKKK